MIRTLHRPCFDDQRLVNNAGLLLPATPALRLGLGELVDQHVDLGDAPGQANAGDKLMTLVASALAGGDCIDAADALRSGSTGRVLGCVVKVSSTLRTFLRSFRWGHVRQLDRVSRELLAGARYAGAGPGDRPLTIDLDSTTCETYGLAKEWAYRHGGTGSRSYRCWRSLPEPRDDADVLGDGGRAENRDSSFRTEGVRKRNSAKQSRPRPSAT